MTAQFALQILHEILMEKQRSKHFNQQELGAKKFQIRRSVSVGNFKLF